VREGERKKTRYVEEEVAQSLIFFREKFFEHIITYVAKNLVPLDSGMHNSNIMAGQKSFAETFAGQIG
jgi:hypothetical protein